MGVVGGKATDAHLVKGLAGSGKAGVIGGQRDAVFLKKAAVDHKAVGVGAYGQPVYAAVLIAEDVEVGIVDGAGLVGGGKVHQAVLQRGCIVPGEAAAGDNIRQTAVFLQKFVEVQIVVAHDELNVYIRQLCLHVWGVFFVEAVAPQIDLNGFGVLLCLHGLGAFSGAAGQQGYTQHHGCKQGGNYAQRFLFHPIFSLCIFDGLPYRL